MKKDVGKVALLPRGIYNATTNYETLDLVTEGNSAYVAITPSIGKQPSTQPLYWMQLCTGQPGGDGEPGGFGTPTATINNATGTPSVVITASGPNTAKVFNFAFSNLKGAKGDKGDKGDSGSSGPAAGFGTPTATINNSTGTPSVSVTASGSDTAKVFNFAFSNLKGDKGDKGDNYTLTSSDKNDIAQTVFDMIGIADLTEF